MLTHSPPSRERKRASDSFLGGFCVKDSSPLMVLASYDRATTFQAASSSSSIVYESPFLDGWTGRMEGAWLWLSKHLHCIPYVSLRLFEN